MTMWFLVSKINFLNATKKQISPKSSAVWPAVSPNCSAVSPKLLSSFAKLLSSFPQTAQQFGQTAQQFPPNCSAVWPNCSAVSPKLLSSLGETAEQFLSNCCFFFAWFCINSSPFFCLFSFLVLDFSLRALVFSKLFLVFCESMAWFVCFGQHRGHACEAKKKG